MAVSLAPEHPLPARLVVNIAISALTFAVAISVVQLGSYRHRGMKIFLKHARQ
ncbi:MAG TPA: hypothetical protein VK993_01185 [Chthoniobacterales bacterium]|nr:hypothetical protein [Chthoniobacterales bacterium]